MRCSAATPPPLQLIANTKARAYHAHGVARAFALRSMLDEPSPASAVGAIVAAAPNLAAGFNLNVLALPLALPASGAEDGAKDGAKLDGND